MRAPLQHGGRQAHALQHVVHALAALIGRQRVEVQQGLLDDVEHALARVQRTERVLVDQLHAAAQLAQGLAAQARDLGAFDADAARRGPAQDRKSTRLNSSHSQISYAVFCLKKKKKTYEPLDSIGVVKSGEHEKGGAIAYTQETQ